MLKNKITAKKDIHYSFFDLFAKIQSKALKRGKLNRLKPKKILN